MAKSNVWLENASGGFTAKLTIRQRSSVCFNSFGIFRTLSRRTTSLGSTGTVPGGMQRVRSRFEEAVRLAEQAFMDELSGLISHLSERLSGADDGKPKIFRDSAIENLNEFFQRFQRSTSNLAASLSRSWAALSRCSAGSNHNS